MTQDAEKGDIKKNDVTGVILRELDNFEISIAEDVFCLREQVDLMQEA